MKRGPDGAISRYDIVKTISVDRNRVGCFQNYLVSPEGFCLELIPAFDARFACICTALTIDI